MKQTFVVGYKNLRLYRLSKSFQSISVLQIVVDTRFFWILFIKIFHPLSFVLRVYVVRVSKIDEN